MSNSGGGSVTAAVAGNGWERYSMAAWARLYQEPPGEGQVEALLQEALARQERSLGPEHPLIAVTLTSLMFLYRRQGKPAEAAAAASRATEILASQARLSDAREPARSSSTEGAKTDVAPSISRTGDEIELSELVVRSEYRPCLPESDPALTGLRRPEGEGWQPGWWKLGRESRWQYGWSRRR